MNNYTITFNVDGENYNRIFWEQGTSAVEVLTRVMGLMRKRFKRGFKLLKIKG
jgi:hypothetical protein